MNASQVQDVGRMLDSFDGGNNLRYVQPKGLSSPPQPIDDLGQEWDQRISSIIKREFDDGKDTSISYSM